MADYTVLLHQFHHLSRLLRRRPQDAHRIGHGAFRILSAIQENGPVSTRELAERLDIRVSSLNEILPRLEQEGLILRTRSKADQRIIEISLSPAGSEILGKSAEQDKEITDLMQQILTDREAEELSSLLKKLTDELDRRTAVRHPFPHSQY